LQVRIHGCSGSGLFVQFIANSALQCVAQFWVGQSLLVIISDKKYVLDAFTQGLDFSCLEFDVERYEYPAQAR
jgi:hypothetical protein